MRGPQSHAIGLVEPQLALAHPHQKTRATKTAISTARPRVDCFPLHGPGIPTNGFEHRRAGVDGHPSASYRVQSQRSTVRGRPSSTAVVFWPGCQVPRRLAVNRIPAVAEQWRLEFHGVAPTTTKWHCFASALLYKNAGLQPKREPQGQPRLVPSSSHQGCPGACSSHAHKELSPDLR